MATLVTPQVVTYSVDDSTKVRFEIDPLPGFQPAGSGEIAGRVQEAVGPAIAAARAVLDKVKEIRPEQVELRFGIKVSGGANWLISRAAAEGSFEITLTWTSDSAAAAAASTQEIEDVPANADAG